MRISDWSSDLCSSDLVQALILLVHLVALARQFLGLLGQLLVGLLQLGLLLLHVRLGLAQGVGLLFQLLVGGAQPFLQIGKASCREGVCRYETISVVAVSLNKKL